MDVEMSLDAYIKIHIQENKNFIKVLAQNSFYVPHSKMGFILPNFSNWKIKPALLELLLLSVNKYRPL